MIDIKEYKDMDDEQLVEQAAYGMFILYEGMNDLAEDSDKLVSLMAEVIGVYEVLIARLLLQDDKEQRYNMIIRNITVLMNNLQMQVGITEPDLVEQVGTVVDITNWKAKHKGTIH